jgi:hypothetical protein
MALNVVTVTGTFFTSSAAGAIGAASGNINFTASDILWNTSGIYVGIVLTESESFNQSGIIAPVQLLAMDNPGFSGNWFWICTIESNGITFPARKLTVDFANGATQDISALLATSTILAA